MPILFWRKRPHRQKKGRKGGGEKLEIPLVSHSPFFPVSSSPLLLLPLSARTENALRDLAQRYVEFLGGDAPPWRDVCYTAAVRRDHHDCRVAVVAQSAVEAHELLQTYLDGATPPNVFSGRKPFGRNLKTAFIYGDRACGIPNSECRIPNGENHSTFLLNEQLALTAWWRSAGLTPDVVLGLGVGEIAAACAAGILGDEDALRLLSTDVGGGGNPPSLLTRAAVLPFVSCVDGQAPCRH